MIGGDSRLAGGGGWRLAVGDWRLVAVGGGWRVAVVGGGWRRLAAGDWLVAVGSGWRLAVGGPLGRSLRAVLKKKNLVPKEPPAPMSVVALYGAYIETVYLCIALLLQALRSAVAF